MATNQYFNKFKNTAEQRLVQDLVDEAIKIHGVNMVYIPRTLVNKDEVFGEDRLPKFENGRELEMYVDSYEGYEGEGELMTQFGLEVRDEITLTVSRKRFLETFADKNYPYPREGDLVFFPLSEGLFEINFIEREQNFFNFGKIFSFQLKCSLFRYSGSEFDTGFDQIDGVTSETVDQLYVAELGSGSGTYTEGEIAYLYDTSGATGATMNVINYDSSLSQVDLQLVEGSVDNPRNLFGNSSSATYDVNSIGLTTDFFVKDVFNDNNTFGLESSTFMDFTDTDPFSEGDL